ncbi:MAG: ABC transporter substrate-binding protein, partial [Oscillospiraceae bacterium]|nr:ABC transporter substrate-binding protein [Oscillospiraceae bacterium]
ATGHTADEFNIQNFGCGGGEAAENYDNYLGDINNDADIMFVEADWALKYINDDSADKGTMALTDIGFSDGDYSDLYGYTVEIGKSTSGVQKGLSWQAAAGGFCYRTDLAETYLGVKSPDEMQALVSDWDKFLETAQKVGEASGGKTALTTTMAGVWQVFSAGRSTPWVVDGKLQIDDSARGYIDFAKSMYDNGYVIKDLAQWNTDWYAAGQTDDTMGYFISTWGFGDSILTQAAGFDGGATYGKWNVVVGPQPFYWGGTWMTVANRCNNQDLVKEFMTYFTTDAAGAESYARFKGEYVSNQKAMEAVLNDADYEGIGVLGGQNHFAVLNTVADGINMAGGITEYDATIKTAFNDAVTEYCRGTYDSVDATIDAFIDNVAGSLPNLDYSDFD